MSTQNVVFGSFNKANNFSTMANENTRNTDYYNDTLRNSHAQYFRTNHTFQQCICGCNYAAC